MGTEQRPSFIVGIGASAGGLESLQRLFTNLPPDLDAAYVVVQHLSPDFESMMAQLLARHTRMTVAKVDEETVVARGKVYVLQRNRELILDGDRLRPVARMDHQAPNLPIDRFLNSLSETRGQFAVAVILSGTGSDGARGVVSIKDAGGFVISEAEGSAKFAGMPESAVRTGCVDLELPAADIGPALRAHTVERLTAAVSAQGAAGQRELSEALEMLARSTGVDYSRYKPGTIRRRFERRRELTGCSTTADYLRLLQESATELRTLNNDLLIGVTRFFRDGECFQKLKHELLPRVLETLDPGADLRAWVAGCASGEEAYSVAITIDELLRERGDGRDFKVFATDVHGDSLDFASAGIYSGDRLADVSAERVERYFEPTTNGFRVVRALRDRVVFAHHDILSGTPFTQMHLICCRNLLIYFSAEAQLQVLSLFHFALRPGGVLFLGPSESIGGASAAFRCVDENSRLFTRRELPPTQVPRPNFAGRRHGTLAAPAAATLGAQRSLLDVYDQLLDRYMPRAILLDSNRCVVDCFGGSEEFLRVPPRRSAADVTSMFADSARPHLSAALRSAASSGSPVFLPGIEILDRSGENGRVDVTVEPLPRRDREAPDFVLVFHAPRPAATNGVAVDGADHSGARMSELESALNVARGDLHSTVEQLEVSNEELQATNEELLASNEELQSTNEELNSVNEELHTLNSEYQEKIRELNELNQDMSHLLEATRIGTVFLDQDLRIRRFTPEAAGVFHFNDSDLGRLLADLAHNLDIDDLDAQLARVVTGGEPYEVRTRDSGGRLKLLRALPYSTGPKVTNVVVTIVDVHALDLAHRAVEEQKQRLQRLIDALPILVAEVGADLHYRAVNRAYGEAHEMSPDELIGRHVSDVLDDAAFDQAKPYMERALDGERMQFEMTWKGRDGRPRILLVHYVPNRIPTVGIDGFHVAIADVTGLRNINQDLLDARIRAESADRAKSEFLANMSHEIRTPLAAMLGHLDLLTDEIGGKPATDSVEVIRRNGQHLLSIINDILDVASLAHNEEPQVQPVAICGLVADLAMLLGPRACAKGLELRTKVPDDGAVVVRTDPRRIRQILMNLIGNAIKFTKVGSVSVTAAWGSGALTIDVEDTGIGIPANEIDRLFRPFEQLDGSWSRSFEGTGLGLSISRRLAEQLGGRISVESAPLAGSRFRLTVPAERIRERESDVTDGAPASDLTLDARILVVDDSDDAREVTRRQLESVGARVSEAGDGPSGLAEIRAAATSGADFDLLLLDIQMPGMDGLTVARQLRREGFAAPIIALTAGAMSRDRARALAAGCDEHVAKPIERIELVQIAHGLLAARADGRNDRSVLLIEDHADYRLALASMLRSLDYVVLEAGSVAEAEEVFASEAALHAVVTDIQLADGSGLELAERLKSRSERSGTRLIAISGTSAATDVHRQPFDAWLLKPATRDQLRRALSKMP